MKTPKKSASQRIREALEVIDAAGTEELHAAMSALETCTPGTVDRAHTALKHLAKR